MIKDDIAQEIKKIIDIETINLLTPKRSEWGDFAVHTRHLQSQNPTLSQDVIIKNLEKNNLIKKVYEKDGFINLQIKDEIYLSEIRKIIEKKDTLISNIGNEKKVIVEYSSPNIAKPFTVGHLRSTIIGDALANLLESTGHTVYRDSHVGDWGTQFGKQILAIKKWGDVDEIASSNRPVKLLVDLYVKFHTEAEKNPELNDDAREWFYKLENNDKEARNIWKKCVEWSWIEFDKIYKALGINITENNGHGFGESFFEDKMNEVILELEAKKLLKVSEGAKLVFFLNDKYPPLMIIKKDGATLYATRDLATDKFRLNRYGKDILIINEVGIEQSLYFQQLYELESMLGWFKREQRIHVKHGMYRFKSGKMSTRKGNVIWLEDVLDEAISRAKKISSERSISNEISKKIAVGALKWNDLKRDCKQDVVFDWDDILNMSGNSGPYMQYTYARIQSIFNKIGNKSSATFDDVKLNTEERALVSTLTLFQETVESATINYSPHLICNYLYDLAQKFNLFYEKCPILKADKPTQNLRLLLATSTALVIKDGLNLLGIEVVDKI